MSTMHAVRRAGTFLLALGLVVLPASPGGAETATDGTRTLTVSQATGLDPAGQMVRVTGSGYDTFKGIYVAFCVVPAPGQAPSPCGGGVDMAGGSGASHWISSNPPPYGQGVATPYGPGGSFDVTVAVSAMLNATVDCRVVQCAIVTRNDHTRASDRAQDVVIPVHFASPATPPPASSGNPPIGASSGASPAPESPTAPDAGVAPVDDTVPDDALPSSTTTAAEAEATTTTPSGGEVRGGELAAASVDDGGGGSGAAVIGVSVAVAAIVLGFTAFGVRRWRQQRA